MEKELRKKWVLELRSGKYKQIQGALKKDGGYCCLGVLMDVAGMEIDQDSNYDGLPLPEQCEILGLQHDRAETLAGMNDGVGYAHHNFSGIADYIEMENK